MQTFIRMKRPRAVEVVLQDVAHLRFQKVRLVVSRIGLGLVTGDDHVLSQALGTSQVTLGQPVVVVNGTRSGKGLTAMNSPFRPMKLITDEVSLSLPKFLDT